MIRIVCNDGFGSNTQVFDDVTGEDLTKKLSIAAIDICVLPDKAIQARLTCWAKVDVRSESQVLTEPDVELLDIDIVADAPDLTHRCADCRHSVGVAALPADVAGIEVMRWCGLHHEERNEACDRWECNPPKLDMPWADAVAADVVTAEEARRLAPCLYRFADGTAVTNTRGLDDAGRQRLIELIRWFEGQGVLR